MIHIRLFFAFSLAIPNSLLAKGVDDAYGDPLPAGAKLRLGTARMRSSYTSNPTALTPDGKFLVGRTAEGAIHFIDPTDGKTSKGVPVKGEYGSITGFSADGHRAVVAGYGAVSVLDVENGKVVNSLKRVNSGDARSVSLSADGKRLAVGGTKQEKENATAVVWDVDGNKQIASITPLQNQVVYVALSPDGKRLATWGFHNDPNAKGLADEATDPNRTIQFWDVQSGKETGKGHVPATTTQMSVAFSPDGSLAAVSGGNGLIDLIDPATGAKKLVVLGRSGAGQKIAFNPDGRILAASGEDGSIQQWALPDGKRLGVTEAPNALAYSIRWIQFVDKERIVVWATHGYASFIWEAPSGKLLSPGGGNFNNVIEIVTAKGGKEVLTAASDGLLIRWDPATGKQLDSFSLKTPNTSYGSSTVTGIIALTSNGTQAIAIEGYNSGLGVYDLSTGKQQFVIPGETNKQCAGSLTPDGGKIVQMLTSYDQKIPARAVVWDIASAAKLGSVELPGVQQLAATVTPDGKILITAGKKRSDKGAEQFVVNGWELATGKKLGEFSEESAFGSMYVLAAGDNKAAIVATPKRRLVAIDVLTGKLVREFDTGGQGSVVQPALSPDMQSVAMGQPLSFGKDGTAKILVFDVESGKLKMSFPGPSANLSALSFSPDGKYLFSGSVDTTALMWDLTAK